MAMCVTAGASMQCAFGAALSTLVTAVPVIFDSAPAAVIMDNKPIANILPFGMCSSMANPAVASATAAALGVLTPMPCVPNTPVPWMPGSTVLLVGGKPALLSSSKLMCAYGGSISIVSPKNSKVISK